MKKKKKKIKMDKAGLSITSPEVKNFITNNRTKLALIATSAIVIGGAIYYYRNHSQVIRSKKNFFS